MSDPLRTCMGCGAKKIKKELCRLAIIEDIVVVEDRYYRMTGRGAYTCHNRNCLRRFLNNTKKLYRTFRKQNLTLGKDLVAIFRSK